jgi:hypothetical protein
VAEDKLNWHTSVARLTTYSNNARLRELMEVGVGETHGNIVSRMKDGLVGSGIHEEATKRLDAVGKAKQAIDEWPA